MAKITYQDKVDLYENANVQHINKVIADDMNEIKDAVNDNETKILIAVSDTAPSTCAKDDLYYNTTQNKIFVATATNTWSSTGTTPTENTIYILFDTKTTYSYDGNSLVSIGGGEDEIAISTSEPTEHEKLWVNPNQLVKAYGSYISNEYGTSQTIGYSQEYVNGKLLWANQNPTSAFTSSSINLTTNNCDFFEVIYATNLSETNETASTGRIPFGKRVRLNDCFAWGNTMKVVQRVITTSSNTTLTLEAGYSGVPGSVGADNSACVPLYVIGYKSGILN